MANEEKKLVEIENLRKYFPIKGTNGPGVQAVQDVSLYIKKGETLGLVGESGCGKTTLGRTILRLYEPTGGKIIYDGQTIFDNPLDKDGKPLGKAKSVNMLPYRKKMQIIFQDPSASLDPRMTVGEIIGEAIDIHKLAANKKDRADMIKGLLARVGLNTEHANRYPHEFSGGQQQRVGIARALAVKPEFIVCDEPISALDVSIQSQVVNMLEDMQAEMGLTYLFIAHDLSVVRHISNRIGVMYLGGLVETGTTADIFANPQSEVAKELIRKDTGSDIDADSRLDAVREKGQAEIKSGEKIRIVFSENSAFEPVIANLILTFGEPVNILKADTKNVGGVAKGEMILEFMEGSTRTEMMKQYLKEKGLAIGEVTEYVGS